MAFRCRLGTNTTWYRYLQHAGVAPHDRVAVLLPNCAELLFVFFETTKLGGIFVPLNHKLTAPELAQIVADAKLK